MENDTKLTMGVSICTPFPQYKYDKFTLIQTFLDIEAMASNGQTMLHDDIKQHLPEIRRIAVKQLEQIRQPAPACYGLDDCSTYVLSRCPWRMTCGA